MNGRQKSASELKKVQKDNDKDSKAYQEAEAEIEKLNEEVKEFKNTFFEHIDGSFTYSFWNALESPEIPEIPKLENGAEDSMFAYKYYRDHFFDGFNFTDERLVRTAAFHEKIVFHNSF